MKAMVLAAGEGTRLRPLTLTTPKPMIPVGNIPLIERTLRWLAREGIKEVMINVHHLPQVIMDFVGTGRLFGVTASFSHEEVLLGTAGGVKNCQSHFGVESFFVIYGDNLLDVQLKPLIDAQKQTNADVVIGLFNTENPTACGLVQTDDDGRVTKFLEKPKAEEVFTDQANAGVYLVNSSIFDYISAEGASDFGLDVFPAMLQDGRRLQGVVLGGYIQDTGTPENYRKVNEDALTGKVFGLRGRLVANDPNYTLIGDRAHLSPGVTFRGINIVGPRTHVGARVELQDTIVWEDVKIPEDFKLSRAIIGSGVELKQGDPIDEASLIALEQPKRYTGTVKLGTHESD